MPAPSSIRDEIFDIYTHRATKRYGLSAVNQQQHALQSAAIAEANGEPPSMIVAALLHDVGHMIHSLGEDPAKDAIDDRHEEIGALWLAHRFGPDVTEPVRLHVPAKRYLCAVDTSYFGRLSADSVRSLELQGGPMTRSEVQAFDRLLYAEPAIRLRRIDEAAKVPTAQTPDVGHFMMFVDTVLRESPS
jgi:[1-hydroxy-2-(trimethylamino)ethyl]phosphonate dioxygenase